MTIVLAMAVAGCGVASAHTIPGGTVALTRTSAQHPLRCHAWVTNRYPLQDTYVGIRVHAVRRAQAGVTAHYRTVSFTQTARLRARTRHTFWYSVGNATPGYRINVHIRVSASGRTGSCRTWFTPRGAAPPPPTPSPSPSSSPTPTPTPTPSPTHTGPPPPPGPSCTATVWTRLDSDQDEWLNDVYVHSNQPNTEAYASADGQSENYRTDSSGYADIWLNGPGPGAQITVTVGGATCYTSS